MQNNIKRPKKAKNRFVTKEYLVFKTEYCLKLGYAKPKWIYFCEQLLSQGFEIYLYEAKKTVSKYLTLKKDGKTFKVRFSNHRPNAYKEQTKDCDFFVGVSNMQTTTTEDALKAVAHHFNKGEEHG